MNPGNLEGEGERFPQSDLVTQICHADQQKAARFKGDFDVSCASYIATLLTMHNGPFSLRNLTENSLM